MKIWSDAKGVITLGLKISKSGPYSTLNDFTPEPTLTETLAFFVKAWG